MRAAIRALPAKGHTRRGLAAWASLPPLYHRWAMGPGGESYLVAERHGHVLGYAARRGGELTAVFVRPGAQGKGVGRLLVGAACAAAVRGGHRSARVLAARAAVGFYAALGFRAGAGARVPLPGGLSLAAVRMRRALAPKPSTPARRGGGTGSAGRPRAPTGAGRRPPRPRSAAGR